MAQGLSEEAQSIQGAIWTAQAGSCAALSLAGEFLLLISLLAFLFIYVQTMKLQIEGSNKLGQLKHDDPQLRLNASKNLVQIGEPIFSYDD